MSWRTTRAAARTLEPNRQVAVIDLGSNSWRLVVFTFVPNSWWKRTDELYETVRIGEGMSETGRLGEKAIARALETLTIFEHFCASAGLSPDQVHAVATSAIRDAENREEFLRAAEESTPLRIEVLSAEEEARLGYLAAVNTSTIADGAVLELGGGSMQLIQVAERRAKDAGVDVKFAVADSTKLEGYTDAFDTVIDSGMFHCLDDDGRRSYAAAVHRATRPGASLVLSCFSDANPVGKDWRPAVSEDTLRDVLGGAGWDITSLEPATLPGELDGAPVEMAFWYLRAQRR